MGLRVSKGKRYQDPKASTDDRSGFAVLEYDCNTPGLAESLFDRLDCPTATLDLNLQYRKFCYTLPLYFILAVNQCLFSELFIPPSPPHSTKIRFYKHSEKGGLLKLQMMVLAISNHIFLVFLTFLLWMISLKGNIQDFHGYARVVWSNLSGIFFL